MSTINGDVSFWQAQLGAPPRRAPLSSSTSVDVCIVGAGLTGLWTAYYLKQAAPSLSIAVLEREYAGFGASGRNGGWLSALVAGSSRSLRPTLWCRKGCPSAAVDDRIRGRGHPGRP